MEGVALCIPLSPCRMLAGPIMCTSWSGSNKCREFRSTAASSYPEASFPNTPLYLWFLAEEGNSLFYRYNKYWEWGLFSDEVT